MRKKLFAILLAAAMLFALTACSASSSSTSTVTVSTSVTDENGSTTTNTTTREVGVNVGTDGVTTTRSTESSSTTTDSSPEDIVAWWYETYQGGAIGENAAGDRFLLAYDDPENITEAVLTIVSADGSSIYIREGIVRKDGEGKDEHLVLVDEDRDTAVPFDIYDSDKGDFELYFYGDGDSAVMNVVDQDTILGEMRGVLETITAAQASNAEANADAGQ